MSSSAASLSGGGAGAIRTDITVTAITRTVTMDTVGTRTAMGTAGTVTRVAPVMDTAMAAGLTRSLMPLDQVARCIVNTHSVM